MGLIKSDSAPTTLLPFSMKDVEMQARALLLGARRTAERLLVDAQKSGEQLRDQAQAEGFESGKRDGLRAGHEEGFAAGRAQALSDHSAALEASVSALSQALADIEKSRRALEAEALSDVVRLAVAIAQRVTKRQAALDPQVMVENLRESMRLVVHAADVRVVIHPDQRAVLDEALPQLQLEFPQLQHVKIIDDASLTPGGCRVMTAGGEIDADLNLQLDRVVADLLPAPNGGGSPSSTGERSPSSGTPGRAGEGVSRMVLQGSTSRLPAQLDAVEASMPFGVSGRVQGISGMTIEASDLSLPLGSLCKIHSFGGKTSTAEVIGFRHDKTLLMTLSTVAGVSRGDRVVNISAAPRIWCSEQLLGRVLNGFGEPTDNGPPLILSESRRIDGRSVAPLDRENIRQPISTGVRAIDGLMTCGLGQRMGIFSGPGVGKSTLMSWIAKHTSADVSVIALIGERGREVQEFLHNSLGPDGLKRCVVIVATGDDAPLLRVRAARVACTISEYFRDQGLNVLLLMDSLTRLCQAQRLIGLAVGEPPATKGFPPSAFAILPEILERAGKMPHGSITGFYTTLVEGDDFNEPIPDAVKGITDGHLWLSRSLSNRGHYPAIDVLQSISRVRSDVTDEVHSRAAVRVLKLTTIYQDIEDLVNIGDYVPGRNVEFDVAVQVREKIVAFLQQDARSPTTLESAKKQLLDLDAWIEQVEKLLRNPKKK